MLDPGSKGQYGDYIANNRVEGLPNVPNLKDTIIEEDLHTSIASDCQSYESDMSTGNASQKNVKYKFTDTGSDYIDFTEKNLSKFTIGNGMISKELLCMKFITDNPVSAAFLKREKGRLPYSVFKAT